MQNNKDYLDQSLDEIKLLKYVNKHDPDDHSGILQLYDYFYYKVKAGSSQLPNKTSTFHKYWQWLEREKGEKRREGTSVRCFLSCLTKEVTLVLE